MPGIAVVAYGFDSVLMVLDVCCGCSGKDVDFDFRCVGRLCRCAVDM